MKDPKVSLIVLTRNEKEGLEKIMPRVKKSWVDEILVVDGNSTDGTIEAAKKIGLKVVQQTKMGRGNAFRVGLENAKGDMLIYFSPDGNEVPEDIPKIINKMKEGHDMVIASRFSKLSKSEDATFVRLLGNKMFTVVINSLYGTKLTDALNGFRAIKTNVMKEIDTTAEHFDIEIQMSMRCIKNGYKVDEIPTVEPNRIGGVAKLNTFVDGWRCTKFLVKEIFHKKIKNNAK